MNKSLVTILESRGVPASKLLALQRDAVRTIEAAQQTYPNAARLFRVSGLGRHFHVQALFEDLAALGIDFDSSPKGHVDFLKSATMLAITHCLRDAKYKARIPVASPTLLGICDTWGILKPDQIYACVSEKNLRQTALRGKVLVTRRYFLLNLEILIIFADRDHLLALSSIQEIVR
jgi:hypothetical protein